MENILKSLEVKSDEKAHRDKSLHKVWYMYQPTSHYMKYYIFDLICSEVIINPDVQYKKNAIFGSLQSKTF